MHCSSRKQSYGQLNYSSCTCVRFSSISACVLLKTMSTLFSLVTTYIFIAARVEWAARICVDNNTMFTISVD